MVGLPCLHDMSTQADSALGLLARRCWSEACLRSWIRAGDAGWRRRCLVCVGPYAVEDAVDEVLDRPVKRRHGVGLKKIWTSKGPTARARCGSDGPFRRLLSHINVLHYIS